MAGTYSATQFRNKTVVTTFLRYAWEILTWYLVCWVYNDELQIKFTFCSGSMIFGPWTLKFGQIFSCHHDISLWFQILTWFLAWECIMISYRSTLKFILFDFWPTYSCCWALKFGQIYSCQPFFFTMIWDIDLIFGRWVYSDELPIEVEFHSDWMILS